MGKETLFGQPFTLWHNYTKLHERYKLISKRKMTIPEIVEKQNRSVAEQDSPFPLPLATAAPQLSFGSPLRALTAVEDTSPHEDEPLAALDAGAAESEVVVQIVKDAWHWTWLEDMSKTEPPPEMIAIEKEQERNLAVKLPTWRRRKRTQIRHNASNITQTTRVAS